MNKFFKALTVINTLVILLLCFLAHVNQMDQEWNVAKIHKLERPTLDEIYEMYNKNTPQTNRPTSADNLLDKYIEKGVIKAPSSSAQS